MIKIIVNIMLYFMGILIVYAVIDSIITLIKDFPESLGAILFIAVFSIIFYVFMRYFEEKFDEDV